LTPKAVEIYRQNVVAELGLKNVAAVVRYAIKHELTKLDD